MIKAVIFDMGGVVNKDMRQVVDKEVSNAFHMDIKKIKPVMKNYISDLQKDYIGIEDFWKYVCRDLNVDVPYSSLERTLEETHRKKAKIKKSMIALIRKLKKNYKVGLITNTIHGHYQFSLEQGWYDPFDVAIISNIVKLRKPEIDIYKLTLNKLGVRANEAVFIDNEEEFLVPAKQLGIKAIHFTSVKKLKQGLNKLKVL